MRFGAQQLWKPLIVLILLFFPSVDLKLQSWLVERLPYKYPEELKSQN
jgi:hypothetical protein